MFFQEIFFPGGIFPGTFFLESRFRLREDKNANLMTPILINTKKSSKNSLLYSHKFIHLCGVLGRFQHCTGHITTGSFVGQRKPVHTVGQEVLH